MKWLKGLFNKQSAIEVKEAQNTLKINNFVKIFDIPNGQVIVELEYPESSEELFAIIQRTVVRNFIKAKITSDFKSEAEMLRAFSSFDHDKAVKFNEEIEKIID